MKKLLIPVLLLAVIATGYIWWSRRPVAPTQEHGQLVLYGNVDIRQVSLAFEGSGRVAAVRVEEGDEVQSGAVVAVLDTSTLALQAAQVEAEIDAQQQAVRRLRNGARPQEVSQARSRVEAALADAGNAERELARLQGISKATDGRGVSPLDLERATKNVQVATARVDEQREALRLVELGPRTEDVAGAEAQLKAARARLALLEHQIALGELHAPTDGVVRTRLLEPGDMATPQRPVIALAITRPKWVRVYVNETDLGHVTAGMAARVVTDSQPDTPLPGRVGYISSVAEFTPKSVQTEELRTTLVYEVRVNVEDEANVLRLGQPATVYLDGRAAGAAR